MSKSEILADHFPELCLSCEIRDKWRLWRFSFRALYSQMLIDALVEADHIFRKPKLHRYRYRKPHDWIHEDAEMVNWINGDVFSDICLLLNLDECFIRSVFMRVLDGEISVKKAISAAKKLIQAEKDAEYYRWYQEQKRDGQE